MDEVLVGTLLASTLRVATPLILCALASTLSERAGVIDLGLEGKMLATAFAAASVAALSGSLLLGHRRGHRRRRGAVDAAWLCLRQPPW